MTTRHNVLNRAAYRAAGYLMMVLAIIAAGACAGFVYADAPYIAIPCGCMAAYLRLLGMVAFEDARAAERSRYASLFNVPNYHN